MCHAIKITQGTICVYVWHFTASNYIKAVLDDRLEPYHLEGCDYSGGIPAKSFRKAAVMSVSHNMSIEDSKRSAALKGQTLVRHNF